MAHGVNQRGDCQRDIDLTAVPGKADRFVMFDAFACAQPRQYPFFFIEKMRRDDARDLPADHLLGAVAEHAGRAGVPTGDGSIERLADNGVGRGLDDGCKPGVSRPRRLRRRHARAGARQKLGHADNECATRHEYRKRDPVRRLRERNENEVQQHCAADARKGPAPRPAEDGGYDHGRVRGQIGDLWRRASKQRQLGQDAQAGGQRANGDGRPPRRPGAPRLNLQKNTGNLAQPSRVRVRQQGCLTGRRSGSGWLPLCHASPVSMNEPESPCRKPIVADGNANRSQFSVAVNAVVDS